MEVLFYKIEKKLRFPNLKFKKDENNQYIEGSVYYECEFCKYEIKEFHKK